MSSPVAVPIVTNEVKSTVTPDSNKSVEVKGEILASSTEQLDKGVTPLLSEDPYISEYYDIKGVWNELSDDIQDSGEVIMDYFKGKVKSEKFSDNHESFAEVMRRLERMTDTKHSPLKSKLSQMSSFIKSLNRMKRMKRWQLYICSDTINVFRHKRKMWWTTQWGSFLVYKGKLQW